MTAKRYGAEFIGTFAIVFAPVAFAASADHSGAGLMGAAWVSGLVVMAMIYALGPISAAHFNPAVTIGFTLAGRFHWRYVVPYVVAQFAGAIAAAAFAALLFGSGFGVHIPSHPDAVIRNLGTEVAISFFLMLVIIATATDRRVSSTVPGLAIGMTVVFGVVIGGPITGGSMNPARSFGPALVAGGPALGNVWLYFVGPLLGAGLAALIYERLRLDPTSATGAPNELFDALEEIEATPR